MFYSFCATRRQAYDWLLLILPAFFPASHLVGSDRPAKRSPDEVLLISNESSPISKAIADDYATKRQVRRRLSVRCADSAISTENETATVKEYRDAIEAPVRAYLAQHPEIQFIVLTKGLPLRISGAETGERPVDSSAKTPLNSSLDSRLAALGYETIPDARTLRITGSGATGRSWINRYWDAKEPFSHQKFGGYLVTRLDGYTEAVCKGLVNRALEAERKGLPGKVLLDVQRSFGLGDKADAPKRLTGAAITDESPWDEFNADMCRANEILKQRGVPSELDLSENFVGKRSGLAGYFSWGSNDQRFSKEAYASLEFAPGSIGDTAVSTSARTFLPTEGGQSLIANLIAHGLTCAKGYTDEPLLQAIASPTILLDRYLAGYSMAESFYAASHFVGWQDVVIGDPLCTPFPGGVRPPGSDIAR